MDNYIKGLLLIIVVLFIAVYILFNVVLDDSPKEDSQINKNPSSIQDRRDALKNLFK
ncbi:hypothetical protein [Aliarcobacter trophiarum]|uniref:Uncharacterized protein n=1 Tax=Aliarcobacter trophiarum LMG 25534 TaxID=1032241 RepID=A0AAD0QKH4_9BACT|nr:hypothetical protein [Aliarcobacter trophiarum]AXK49421.1 hypothetical protein ATR_1592 [Aliarcobacter trophiarum LMG 25534]